MRGYSKEEKIKERCMDIRRIYGELLDLAEVAEVFHYSKIDSVRKAWRRGSLPVSLYKFPRKNGWFAKADEVAEAIENMKDA